MRKNFGYDYFCAHVCGKLDPSQKLQLSMDEVWKVFNSAVRNTLLNSGVQVNGFVLMSNHYHLLCSSTVPKMEKIIDSFVSYVDARIQGFETRTLWIDNYVNYLNVVKYIYRNPVEAGLADHVEDYKYSSLYYLLGKGPEAFPVVDNMHIIYDPQRRLQWLNHSGSMSLWEIYRVD